MLLSKSFCISLDISHIPTEKLKWAVASNYLVLLQIKPPVLSTWTFHGYCGKWVPLMLVFLFHGPHNGLCLLIQYMALYQCTLSTLFPWPKLHTHIYNNSCLLSWLWGWLISSSEWQATGPYLLPWGSFMLSSIRHERTCVSWKLEDKRVFELLL